MTDETAASPASEEKALTTPLGKGPKAIATEEQLASLLDDTTGRAVTPLDGLLVYRQGKEDYFKRGEDRVGSVTGIFLLSRRPTRAFWEKEELSGEAPSCYSFDGLVPAPQIDQPQSEECKGCRWDEMGSGKGGAKKCKTKAADFMLVVPDNYERDTANNLAWVDPKKIVGPGVILYSIGNRGSARGYQAWLTDLKEKGLRPQGVLTRWSFGLDRSKSNVDYNFVAMETVMPLPDPTHDPALWSFIVEQVQGLKGGNADQILSMLTGQPEGGGDKK